MQETLYNKSDSYSVIIPVYNSTSSLNELTKELTYVFSTILKASFYEIIFVNDNSPNPLTLDFLNEIHINFPHVKIINLTRNFGQQSATICGINYASGEYIITMDDDMQHSPLEIPKLLKLKNHDIVFANLQNKKTHFLNRITSNIKAYFDYILIDKPKDIKLSSFRLIRSNIAKEAIKIETAYPFLPALLFHISNDICSVNIEHNHDVNSKSNYTFKKRYKVFLNLLINNSSFLLKSLGYIGASAFLLSFILAIYFIYKKMFLGVPIGFTSIIISILFFGGLNLLAFGILGEYFIRLLASSEKKPKYVVKSITT
tara:strand:+ start:706 stop:1650 length:945 start_codon:yes stop_codon:yes gene_type:complete